MRGAVVINENGGPSFPIVLAANVVYAQARETSWSVGWESGRSVEMCECRRPVLSSSLNQPCLCAPCVYPQRTECVSDACVVEMGSGVESRVVLSARVCRGRRIVCGASGEKPHVCSVTRRIGSACESRKARKSRETSVVLRFDRCGPVVVGRWCRYACLPHEAVRAISRSWDCGGVWNACDARERSMG